MSGIERRLQRLEEAAALESAAEETNENGPDLRDMWERQLESAALHIVRGGEPDFTLDERDAFWTLDGRFALAPWRVDLSALMGPDTQRIQESMPPERWERFLAADEEAAEALDRLRALAGAADVPDAYREPGHEWHNQGEINDARGDHDLGSVFVDADEREQTRRLTWTLIHVPAARALLSELTRRRDAFVVEEEGART